MARDRKRVSHVDPGADRVGTLAAFLWALDQAVPGEGLQVLYVSPLKALNYDVERNLRAPLAGIGRDLRVAVRTGGTPQCERAQILRRPPEILITTPESLFLMLTVALDALVAHVKARRGSRLATERFDGESVAENGMMELLVASGFTAGPRRAVLRSQP